MDRYVQRYNINCMKGYGEKDSVNHDKARKLLQQLCNKIKKNEYDPNDVFNED